MDRVDVAPESAFGQLKQLRKLTMTYFCDYGTIRMLNTLYDANIAIKDLHLRVRSRPGVGDAAIDAVIQLKCITRIALGTPTVNLMRAPLELENLEHIYASHRDRVGIESNISQCSRYYKEWIALKNGGTTSLPNANIRCGRY